MNWVGGIRSRVRQQAEKKKQKEFFERQRLLGKVKKVTNRPKSPQDRSVRGISKDLLYLQAVSKANDFVAADDEVALSRVKRLKLTGPRSLWPERDLVLPMSPIGQPSTLELQDCETELASLFAARRVPRVSTQKLSHQTTFKGFGPGQRVDSKPSKNRGSFNQSSREGASLWTESVFPVKRGDPEGIGNLSMASSFMNESLGPMRRRDGGRSDVKKSEWMVKPSFKDTRERKREMIGTRLTDRQTRRRSLVAEKSYDHETPFNFGAHPVDMEQEHVRKELPKTRAALLDFHANQNPAVKHKVFGEAKMIFGREGGKNRTSKFPADGEDPVHFTAEPEKRKEQKQWDTITPHKKSLNTTTTSSAFAENPLSRKAGPTSCCTVFNESVLGPIMRHNNPGKTTRPAPQEVHQEHTVRQREGSGAENSGEPMSAFEKMMSTFDAYKETAGVVRTEERAVNGGTSAGKTLFGGGGWGGCGAEQNKMWQDFVSGCTRDPHTTHNTAAHKQWQQFTSGVEKASSTNSPKDTCQRVPDGNGDCQEDREMASGNGECSAPASVERKFSRRSRVANVSVLDELMCLEEIGSVSTQVMASQEISFTPVVAPSQLVPDIDVQSTTAQRCMSENPLKICHTPAHELRIRKEPEDKPTERERDKMPILHCYEEERLCTDEDGTVCDEGVISHREGGSDETKSKTKSSTEFKEARTHTTSQMQTLINSSQNTALNCGGQQVENEPHIESHNETDAVSHTTNTEPHSAPTHQEYLAPLGEQDLLQEGDYKREDSQQHLASLGEQELLEGGDYKREDSQQHLASLREQELLEGGDCKREDFQQHLASLGEQELLEEGDCKREDSQQHLAPLGEQELEGGDRKREDCASRSVSIGVQTTPPTKPCQELLVPLVSNTPREVVELTDGQQHKHSASVAVQCSLPVPLSTCQDRYTQTLNTTYKDTAVQTADTDDDGTNLESDASNDVGSTGEQRSAQCEMDTSSDGMSALQNELESMQNTVIWQALMLRLYEMH